MDRRHFILTSFGAALLARPALAAPGRLEVFKSPACGCCSAWVENMDRAGFDTLVRDVDQETLRSIKDLAGVTPELRSCHTAFIDGYFVEGHVPAGDVQRLLSELPDALGLAVPGMPIGSPGMEMGNRRDPYDTLLVTRDGSARIFESHA